MMEISSKQPIAEGIKERRRKFANQSKYNRIAQPTIV